MPSSVAGSSVTFQSYPSPVNAQVSASKQAPPPSRKNTTLVGSARRSQNTNLLPSAHSQSPPGGTCFHGRPPAGGVAALLASRPLPHAATATVAAAIAPHAAIIAITPR